MAFFEKIGGAITNGVSATANKTKEFSGATKDNMELSSKKKELNGVYTEIGKLFVNGNDDEKLKELKGKAVLILDEIDSLESKIADGKGMKKCEHCGMLIDNASVFCGHCGGKQENITNKCPKCKTILPEGTLFCVNCGTKQNVTGSSAVQEEKTEETVQNIVQEVPAVEEKEAVEVIENVVEEIAEQEEIQPIIEPEKVPETTENTEENQPPKPIFCTNCGHKEMSGSKFCTECGNKL